MDFDRDTALGQTGQRASERDHLVQDVIDDNEGLWGDDQPVIGSDYGSVIPGRIILNRSFDNE